MIEVRELTARAPGAVAILELRGEEALAAAKEWTRRSHLEVGELFATRLEANNGALDEALVVVRESDCVEVHLHGSPPLVEEVLEFLEARFGATRARQRASLEDCARQALLRAPSELGARLLLEQAEGALRQRLEALLALEDSRFAAGLAEFAQDSHAARYLLRPAVCVLAGPVNAGKSTLFNLLVGEDRALTSEREGTTRDLLRARGQLGPWPIDWIDTAGERGLPASEPQAEVERAGQALAQRVLETCDLAFWLAPDGKAGEFAQPCVSLRTFADDPAARGSNAISATEDPEHAARAVRAHFEAALELSASPWSAGTAVVFDAEQRTELRAALKQPLDVARSMLHAWLRAN